MECDCQNQKAFKKDPEAITIKFKNGERCADLRVNDELWYHTAGTIYHVKIVKTRPASGLIYVKFLDRDVGTYAWASPKAMSILDYEMCKRESNE